MFQCKSLARGEGVPCKAWDIRYFLSVALIKQFAFVNFILSHAWSCNKLHSLKLNGASHRGYFQLPTNVHCRDVTIGPPALCELSQPEATDCQIIVCDQILSSGNIFSQMRILSHGVERQTGWLSDSNPAGRSSSIAEANLPISKGRRCTSTTSTRSHAGSTAQQGSSWIFSRTN